MLKTMWILYRSAFFLSLACLCLSAATTCFQFRHGACTQNNRLLSRGANYEADSMRLLLCRARLPAPSHPLPTTLLLQTATKNTGALHVRVIRK